MLDESYSRPVWRPSRVRIGHAVIVRQVRWRGAIGVGDEDIPTVVEVACAPRKRNPAAIG